jgi:glycosyl-4,4'-diaponeurosporenoate acyltransferase
MPKILALYAAIWILFHLSAGYAAHRLPTRRLSSLSAASRVYAWEQGGAIYRRIGIRRWKDWLPEAGALYSGGFSKRRLQANDSLYLERFRLETSRAEFSHWLTWSLALTFFLWNPWQIGVVMLLYGAAANLPCILVQRYNRARLDRIVRSARSR